MFGSEEFSIDRVEKIWHVLQYNQSSFRDKENKEKSAAILKESIGSELRSCTFFPKTLEKSRSKSPFKVIENSTNLYNKAKDKRNRLLAKIKKLEEKNKFSYRNYDLQKRSKRVKEELWDDEVNRMFQERPKIEIGRGQSPLSKRYIALEALNEDHLKNYFLDESLLRDRAYIQNFIKSHVLGEEKNQESNKELIRRASTTNKVGVLSIDQLKKFSAKSRPRNPSTLNILKNTSRTIDTTLPVSTARGIKVALVKVSGKDKSTVFKMLGTAK